MQIKPSPQQEAAIKAVQAWWRSRDEQVFRLFGFAGTGKTTLAKLFAGSVKGKVQYGAYTGKAAVVLKKAGCHNAMTIHSMLYRYERVGKKLVKYIDKDGAAARAKLIVIDECSMVGEELGRDLLSLGVPILVLGDPEQLPPVSKDKDRGVKSEFFTAHKPHVMLTEIHRQAEGNPIIQMATAVRKGDMLDIGQFGESQIIDRHDLPPGLVSGADQVLVGRNNTRHSFNRRLRNMQGFDSQLPVPGDRLCCWKNDKFLQIFNGGLFTVDATERGTPVGNDDLPTINMTLRSEDFENRGPIDATALHMSFTNRIALDKLPWQLRMGVQDFDYGYALTVHKAQGSQWDDVVLFDEKEITRNNARRWLYTGITRAAERITIVR